MKTKYVWVKKEHHLMNISKPAFLYAHNTNFNFGDKVYLNSNGYSQKRKTEDYLGMVLVARKNVSISDLISLEKKLFLSLRDKTLK